MNIIATTKQTTRNISQRIKVRQMNAQFTTETPKYWFDNNPYLTALLAGFSVGFPSGERFFIDSVRHFQPQITDPILQDEIKGFIGQEAQHTKEHIAFNNFLEEHGYPANKYAESAKKIITRLQENSSPERNLARTAALEHFTAIMADTFLRHPDVLESIHPTIAKLWAWHSIEEIEHRNVAFDVYKETVDKESLRIMEMILASIGFISVVSIRSYLLHISAGGKLDFLELTKALNILWGTTGIFRKALPQYLAYFKKDFHPSQHDNEQLVQEAKKNWLFEE